jgi:hypothetical protein
MASNHGKKRREAKIALKTDRLEMIIDQRFEGMKYWFFLGSHYHEGRSCWVIAILNKWTNDIQKTHFKTHGECQFRWDKLKKDFVEILERRKEIEEDEEQEEKLIVIN